MRKIIASVLAIAMAGGAAYAQPGNGNDRGGGQGKGNAPSAQSKNSGSANASSGNRGNGNKPAMSAPVRNVPAPVANKDNGKPDRAQGNAGGNRIDRPGKEANGNPPAAAGIRGNGNRDAPPLRAARDHAEFRDGAIGFRKALNTGLIQGCPPRLAKQGTGCIPPGLAKQRNAYFRPGFFGYSNLPGSRYFYDGGYLVRLGSGNSVLGYLPLLGGALSIGNAWPDYYSPVAVPDYYVDYYRLGPRGGYRYADNVLYRVDPETQAITSIAALLTGSDFAVGQPMPAGYDVYNVPYGYRDRYYDGPDARYRYADGYVYRVDPETRLITAAIELLL